MKKLISNLLLVIFFCSIVLTPSKVSAVETIYLNKEIHSQTPTNFKLIERKLWSDNVLWTRNFIMSNVSGMEDKDKVLERLLKNQDDIAASIKPYYGKESAKKLSGLLRIHIVIAGEVVDAAKSGKKDDLEKYNKLWHENVDKIAELLSSLNNNWPKDKLKDMLNKHIQLTTSQIIARLNKKWDEEIDSYDKCEEHILIFADMISSGIIKQSPEKFK